MSLRIRPSRNMIFFEQRTPKYHFTNAILLQVTVAVSSVVFPVLSVAEDSLSLEQAQMEPPVLKTLVAPAHTGILETPEAEGVTVSQRKGSGEHVGPKRKARANFKEYQSASLAVSDCQHVKVEVRTVLGVRSQTEQSQKVLIDSRLRDLAPKLQKLQYDKYQLLSARQESIPVAGRHTMLLSNGQRLTLRPLYVKEERVGMWMKWDDSSGMQIIDTRIHFNCGEDALTALESNPERGLILSVKVTPVRH